ncbi:hypothetical protein, conserved [Leishmania tarentolae]|uniref:Uncharacterized protein n=1 Tax=Leishmania tarentolae TaxID=5689 RepID=A0A640KCW7_LEITA|nr:hypothetical protein, conserved [Leishmania tarentolae]
MPVPALELDEGTWVELILQRVRRLTWRGSAQHVCQRQRVLGFALALRSLQQLLRYVVAVDLSNVHVHLLLTLWLHAQHRHLEKLVREAHRQHGDPEKLQFRTRGHAFIM